jgi:hypothetical protein
MSQRGGIPSSVAKYATLSIVWGIIALVSFVVLPWILLPPATTTAAKSLIENTTSGFCYNLALNHDMTTTTGFCYALNVAQNGLRISGYTGSAGDPLSLLFLLLVILIPVAAAMNIILGFIAATRSAARPVTNLNIVAAIVGIAGTIIMFVPFVAQDANNQRKFLLAAVIVVGTSVLSRVQKQLRKFFQDHPTVGSLGLLVVAYLAVYLTDQITFAAIILTQVGVWLALSAFIVALYATYRTRREAWAARKGKR